MALFNYECDEVKRIVEEVSPNYPQLTTYEKEWLYFYRYGYIPGIPVDLEYEIVNVNPTGSVSNAIPFKYKSAILKGNTVVNMCDDGVADASDITRFTHNYTTKGGTFEQTSDGIKATANGDSSWLVIGYDVRNQQKNTMTIGKKYYGVADVSVHQVSDSCKIVFRTNYLYRESSSLTNGRGLIQCIFTLNSIEGNYGWICVGTNDQNANVDTSFTLHSMSIYEITDEEVNLSYDELEKRYPVKCVGMQSVKMPVLTTSNEDGTKTNILTIDEDVILRSNGDVYDELNLLTGRLTQRIDEDGEVLSQEVVKTVALTPLNNPYEGTNHYELTSNIPCEAILEVPVVSTGKQTLEEINN